MTLESEKHEFVVKNLIQYNSDYAFSCRQLYEEGVVDEKNMCFFYGCKISFV